MAPEPPADGTSPSRGSVSSNASSTPSFSEPPTSPPHCNKNLSLTPVKSPTDNTLTASHPLAAQIPISNFSSLPEFPPEAAHLRSLTLTSDIPLPEYQNLLQGSEYQLPVLPQSITHLTLELFSLGFPGRNPHYLANLARALPNLRSVTFFSCLIDGLDDASRADAEAFFDQARVLREVHLIDSFVRPGFWLKVGGLWEERVKEGQIFASTEQGSEENALANGGSNGNTAAAADVDTGVKVVEVSYTFRGHEDSDFLARVHGTELGRLVVPGLVGVGFGMVEEAEGDKSLSGDGKALENGGATAQNAVGGVLPFANDSRATVELKQRFASLDEGALSSSIKVLNLSLWTLSVADIKAILARLAPKKGSAGTGLIDLTLAVLMSDNWVHDLAEALAASGATSNLEGLEIVGVPSLSKPSGTASGPTKTDEQIDNIMDKGDEAWASMGEKVKLLTQAQATEFGRKCQRLAKIEMSILKARKAGIALFVRNGLAEPWTQPGES
jgi:hypothetical protein